MTRMIRPELPEPHPITDALKEVLMAQAAGRLCQIKVHVALN
jgi:hypothetical protein